MAENEEPHDDGVRPSLAFPSFFLCLGAFLWGAACLPSAWGCCPHRSCSSPVSIPAWPRLGGMFLLFWSQPCWLPIIVSCTFLNTQRPVCSFSAWCRVTSWCSEGSQLQIPPGCSLAAYLLQTLPSPWPSVLSAHTASMQCDVLDPFNRLRELLQFPLGRFCCFFQNMFFSCALLHQPLLT